MKKIIVNGTTLNLCTSIVYFKARYFPREFRWQVAEDAEFILSLYRNGKTAELLWLEVFYQTEFARPVSKAAKASRNAAHKDIMSVKIKTDLEHIK